MNFDDLPDDTEGGEQQQAPLQDFDRMQGEEMEASSPVGSFLRRGLIEAPVGAVAGLAGAGAGALGAAGAGLMTANPIAAAAGGIGAGVPAAMYVGGKAHDFENWLLDKMGLREGTGQFSRAREALDRENNPMSTFAGELAGNVVPSAGVGGGRMVAGRAFSGAMQGGLEAGQEAWNDEDLNPAKIGVATAAGAVFAKPRAFLGEGKAPAKGQPTNPNDPNFQLVGEPYSQPGAPAKWPGMNPEPQRGNPNMAETPDVINQGTDLKEGEVLPPEQPATNPDIEFATQQRDGFDQGDPMWDFWNDHVSSLQEEANNPGKGSSGRTEDATWGPATEDGFTYTTPEDMSRANDLTTTSLGVAADNSRAPEVRGAGNPVGAPMDRRIAARPSDPLRDYRKALPPPEPAAEVSERLPDAKAEPPVAEPLPAEPPGPQTPEGITPQEAPQEAVPAEPRKPRILPDLTQEAPEERVTAAVTPEQQADIDVLRKALGKVSPEHLAAFEKGTPEQQAAAAARARKAFETETKATYDQGARPKTETGLTARSKADAARKQGVLDAYDKAVQEFGRGPADEDPGAMADRLAKMVRRADELAGGNKYRPNEKPASYQLVQAARKAISRPGKASMEAYRKAELAAVEGDSELARANQMEKRIQADSDKRPGLSDAALEAQANKHAVPQEIEREVHPLFDNSLKDESDVFKYQHDSLTNWVNGLSDENYKALAQAHEGDLGTTLKSTDDPRATMHSLMEELADVQRKRPPVLELPAEDAPTSKKVPIKNAADVIAADTGRRIDPNSAEGKAIAAAALARQPKNGGMLDDTLQAERRAYGADVPKDETPVIDGTDRSALEHWARFMADEGGSVPMDKLMKNMSQWMQTRVKDFFHPRADQWIMDYGSQIGMAGTKLLTRVSRLKADVLANARAALYPDGTVPLPAEFGRMYRARETDSLGMLDPRQQKYWQDYVQPLLDKGSAAYDELRDLSVKLKLPGWADMPERKESQFFMPRRKKYSADDEEDFDPIVNRSLSNWAASGQERDWFAFQNTDTGDRKIFRVNDDGKMVFYRDGNSGKAQTPPPGFDPRDIGSTLNVGNSEFAVKHATIDELMQHGRGEGGEKLEFTANPVVAASDYVVGLRSALARVKLLDSILSDPEFAKLNVTSEREAEKLWGKNNYKTTDLPQMKGKFMPKPIAWAFDDLVKTGYHYDNTAIAKLASFSQATLKPFYMLGGQVHVMNEMDKFLVGRGFDNVTPKGLSSVQRNFMKGLRSVKNQDAIQAEIMEAGGNPMYIHALTARLMPQIGKLVGEDMSLKPWKYDPIMKTFGVNSREAMSGLYQQANKAMWWQSDVMYTTLYNEARERGMKPADAVHATEKIIDSYVVPTTFGKSFGLEGTDAGRAMQQFLTDPLTANFGRFSYGLYKTGANIVKNMLGPNSTPADRVKGAGQAAMLMVMANVVYPALSAGYASITGDKNSEFEKRGITRLASLPFDVASGKKDVRDIMHRVWTPSNAADTGMQMLQNRNYAGKPILDQSGGWGRVPGQAAEFAAGQTVSPYRDFSTGLEEGGAGRAFQKLLEGNLGLKTPSQGADKYQQQKPKYDLRNAKQRERHPRGIIESAVNKLVGR